MSRLHAALLAALSTALSLSAPVLATTFAPLTLVQQAKKADVIVQATIGMPTTVTEGTQTYAVYPLKVSETLAGDAAMLPQTVGSQGGGSPALFVLSGVDTAPVFQAGQEAVLLLYKGRLDSPLVGYNQGAYLIANGQVSVLAASAGQGSGAGGQYGASQAVFNQNTSTPNVVTPAVAPATPSVLTPGATTPATTPMTATTPAAATGTPTGTVNQVTVPPVTPAPGTVPLVGTGSTSPSQPVPSTQPTTPAATPGAPVQPAPAAAVQPPPAPGVLGTIRTPAELKAAIVAARAAR